MDVPLGPGREPDRPEAPGAAEAPSAAEAPGVAETPGVAEACEVYQAHGEAVAAARQAMLAEDVVRDLSETFSALGDPTRVRILHALSERELCVCDLADLLSMTPSAVSHQLRLLRNLRLVRPRRAGRMVHYSLDDAHVVDLFRRGLEHVRHGE